MSRNHDVVPSDRRAPGCETGWLGRLHHQIADRAADLGLACSPEPGRVLDVGCGTGYLLRQLAARAPGAAELAGVDPAPAMIEVAGARATDDRLRFSVGAAEQLPYPDGTFDLVVSTTSFDHRADQRPGSVSAPGCWCPAGIWSSPASSRHGC